MATSRLPPPPQPVGAAARAVLFCRPAVLVLLSIAYIPWTLATLALRRDFGALYRRDRFLDAWFAHFWGFLGAQSRQLFDPAVRRLLANNAAGVCLDIGPGHGEWVTLFGRACNPEVTHVYGIEPNRAMHSALRANVRRAGLTDDYTIIAKGAQDLEAEFAPGSVDTIVTIQCLCSIPDPQANINALARLLKPGGRWLLFEHVQAGPPRSLVERWAQLLNTVWPTCFNGCDLRRPIADWVAGAAQWESVDVQPLYQANRSDPVPHVLGIFVKA